MGSNWGISGPNEIAWSDADDRESRVVKEDRFPDHARVRPEIRRPEVVTYKHNRACPRRSTFGWQESPARRRVYSQDLKKIIGNEACRDSFRRGMGIAAASRNRQTAHDHVEATRSCDQSREGAVHVPVIDVFRIGEERPAKSLLETP